MQGLVTAREKPLAQEQWETMKNNAKNNGKQAEIGGGYLRAVA
jgi:hypothetical protein